MSTPQLPSNTDVGSGEGPSHPVEVEEWAFTARRKPPGRVARFITLAKRRQGIDFLLRPHRLALPRTVYRM